MSGRPDSNRLPTAWEAVALPGELLPLNSVKLGVLQIFPDYFFFFRRRMPFVLKLLERVNE